MNAQKYDVVIIGAGVAGLACALELIQGGLKVMILEARGRMGGRIFTQRNSNLKTPVELGAEFIHGTPKSSMSRLAALGAPIYDVCDNHLFFQKGKLQEFNDFWERIGGLTGRLKADRARDRSVTDFLDSQKNLDPKVRQAFTAFVEGFHAANIHEMSEMGLAQTEQTDDDDLNDSSLFRIPGGYDQLVLEMAHQLPSPHETLRLNTVVKKINWRKGSVKIFSQTPQGAPLPALIAKAAVLTIPLGVLKAPLSAPAAIEMDPPPKMLASALAAMKMGDVQRITFQFRTRFWEDLSKQPIGFLHAGPDKFFPTWWTLMPMRTPLLVAWQGGPKAQEMAHWSEEERIKIALQTLSDITGCSTSFLNEQLQSCATHNWTTDPYSLGAYSYVVLDGANSCKGLTRPVEHTLFFAGEATVSGSARGTVHGALQSGVRAAQQILRKSSFSLHPKIN